MLTFDENEVTFTHYYTMFSFYNFKHNFLFYACLFPSIFLISWIRIQAATRMQILIRNTVRYRYHT
jgi:hypothetical protein